MSPRQFNWYLGTRGANLSTWPAADQLAAQSLVRRSASARMALADAIAQEPDSPAPALRVLCGLRSRMRASTPARTGLRWAVLLACTAAGLLLAVTMADPAPDAFTIVQAGAMP